MNPMIAVCGLNCSECGAYLAKKNNDESIRIKTAKDWSNMFQVKINPSDIQCDGCRSEGGVRFQHCSVCEYRACGHKKDVRNCSECDEYPCEKISAFHTLAPEALNQIEKLRHA